MNINAEEIKKKLDEYLANVTLDQLNKDLEKAGMGFYANKDPASEVPCSAGLCPHCGYDIFTECDPFGGCEEKGWYIICPDCIACGPLAETKIEAVRLFRKRA